MKLIILRCLLKSTAHRVPASPPLTEWLSTSRGVVIRWTCTTGLDHDNCGWQCRNAGCGRAALLYILARCLFLRLTALPFFSKVSLKRNDRFVGTTDPFRRLPAPAVRWSRSELSLQGAPFPCSLWVCAGHSGSEPREDAGAQAPVTTVTENPSFLTVGILLFYAKFGYWIKIIQFYIFTILHFLLTFSYTLRNKFNICASWK